MILLIAHDPRFPAGTLRRTLLRRSAAHRTLRLHLGDPFPDDLRRFKAVVALGGDLDAGDDESFPFLRDEAVFLRRAVVAGLPLLGIGFGAQVLARALGGSVRRAPVEERGWSEVRLTAAGESDPLFAGIASPLHVFQWQRQTFTLPPGAELLATADACRNQAFRFAMSWGVQFHPEVDAETIESWAIGSEEYVELRRLQPRLLPTWQRRASMLLGNFLRMSENVGRAT